MEGVVVIARFDPERAAEVRKLLEQGPPSALAESTLDRHAVYLSPHEVVFVFEGPDIEWETEDIADEFLEPGIRTTLAAWRALSEEEPRVGRPVFTWERGMGAAGAPARTNGRVADVMETSFVLVAPEDTLGEAVERMVAGGASLALVGDFGRLIGVLGADDALRTVAERVHPSEGRVREWMSEPPAAIAPDATFEETVATMIETGSHHLPVAQEGRPVGVVDLRSVVGAMTTARVKTS